MYTETKEAFLEYESLKIQSKQIESRLKELQPIVMANVPEDQEIMGQSGKFYLQNRVSWKFSSEVEAIENQLEEAKQDEKARGIAQSTETPVLFYKQLA